MSVIEEIQREIVQTQEFVRERFDPITRELSLVRQEQERLAGEVRRVLEQDRTARREAVLGRGTNDRMRVRGGKLDGFDLVDMAIARSLLSAQQARPQDYDPRKLRAWEESVAKAMDSTTAGAGDELVPQEEARQLWADVNLETAVASLFDTVTNAVESVRHSPAAWRRQLVSGGGERRGDLDGPCHRQANADGA